MELTEPHEQGAMTTIKTIKLKKNPASTLSVAPPDASGMSDAGGTPPAEGATAGAPPPGLEPAAAVAARTGKSFALFAVFGLLSTLAVLTIMVLQYIEMTYYTANPSVGPFQ